MAVGVLFFEIAISFKFVRESGNLVQDPEHPIIVVALWTAFFLAICVWFLKLRFDPNRTPEFGPEPIEAEEKEE